MSVVQQIIFVNRWGKKRKNDVFTKGLPVPFEVIRNPMYKYSRMAKQAFFQHCSELPCLFAWFCRQPDFKAFVLQKAASNSKNDDAANILQHTESLVEEALSSVTKKQLQKALGL